MDILLTGFEPFGGDTVNPSWEVARLLHGECFGDARVHALRLPTAFGTAPPALTQALAELRPRLVVALGQASGRSEAVSPSGAASSTSAPARFASSPAVFSRSRMDTGFGGSPAS
ncbi:MAG: hypothetical protein ACK44A_14345, partial [Roseateles sp.]